MYIDRACGFVNHPSIAAWIVPADADLVVLHVSLDRFVASIHLRFNNFFVYRAHRPGQLHLLPAPPPTFRFRQEEVAVLSRDNDGDYVVAVLDSPCHRTARLTFTLHLCLSSNGGALSLDESSTPPLPRDAAFPVPESAREQAFHVTTKTVRWKATTYSMPIVVSDGGGATTGAWRRDCAVRVDDLDLPVGDDPECCEEEAARTTLSLGRLQMANPALSVGGDDDIVYMLTKATASDASVNVVVAVDVRARALRGATKVGSGWNYDFSPFCFAASGVSEPNEDHEQDQRTVRTSHYTKRYVRIGTIDVPNLADQLN
ncbi:hypothetical protein QOZ80_1AG0011090 [Eleusine coracana subsp. coracana]|nr:hypothetical protein QOZ80_1AG0011090 [Eleusine coracana subsp. coracana]